ncbi:MAG: lipopolysaccharide heptosyltransferase I [Nitrospirota bacterium]
MRVLIVRLSSMGDLVHALPAVTDAASAHPTIQFDWAVDETFSDVPSWHPAVHRIIRCPPRRKIGDFVQSWISGRFAEFSRQIQETRYDLIIDLQGDFKGAIVSRLANGVHAGYDAKSVREWGAQFAYQNQYFVARKQHAIARMRQLMAQAISYPIPNSDPNYGMDCARLPKVSFSIAAPYLVFIHSTSWESKCWPGSYWRVLTQMAIHAGFSVVLPWGSPKERERAEFIANEQDRAFVLPNFSISEKAAIIANAKGTVGCDTGLSHIAAALRIPSVALYGATDPAWVGTVGKNQKQIVSGFECVFCHQRKCRYTKTALTPACLTEITPEQVWDALQAVMQAG